MTKSVVKYANMFNMGCASTFKECLDTEIYEMLNLNELKYFHKLDQNEYYISMDCKMAYSNLFNIDNNSNKVNQKAPLMSNIKIQIDIYSCELCDKSINYIIKFGTEANLGFCPYYENAAIKIQRMYKWYKRLPILYKVIEYYTKEKYSPSNILNYVKLDK